MTKQVEKEIQVLQSRIDQLRAEQERHERERSVLEEAYKALKDHLASAGVSFESFVRFAIKDIRRVTAKLEKEEGGVEPRPVKRKVTKKKAGKKKAAKKGRPRKAARPIKIPAGKYTNIPPETDKVYQVKEKGPRPKPVKEHAQSIGIEKFMEQCRVGD